MIFGLAFVVLMGLLIFAVFIISELSTEARFRSTYGTGWRTEYEETFGPLEKAHTKIAISATGIIAISALLVWLLRLLRPGNRSRRHTRTRKGHGRRYGSRLEHLIWYRGKAILGIYFGLPGIALGVLLAIFRVGIFSDHSSEVILGMFVFLAGYAGVIAGCWCWLKAKGWEGAIVCIGLMPLAIPFIPFVRLILLAAPAILPVGMVMMPLILLTIVFVLPDKSGASSRKSWWNKDQIGWRGLEGRSLDTDASRPNPQGGANGSQPPGSESNQPSSAAGSRRSS